LKKSKNKSKDHRKVNQEAINKKYKNRQDKSDWFKNTYND